MKAILISIRPQWVSKILNGEKTIEIRKKFPKDYVGWVYIYCTKDKWFTLSNERYITIKNEKYHIDSPILNGKVVARFWCDKVEEIECIASDNGFAIERYITKELSVVDIMEKSCLYFKDLKDYLYYSNGYAIHITKLEIFDKPKDISEFYAYSDKKLKLNYHQEARWLTSLTRAPQSWCWIEI